jgi:alpha-2-macroglobulin
MDLSDRIRLARYLLLLPAWRAQGHDMAVKFRESVYETGRTATVNAGRFFGWDDSLAIQQALMLRLMIEDGQDAVFVDRMVQGLLAMRRHGTWSYAYEDAQALGGLIDYGAMAPEPPDFHASAALGPRRLDDVHFAGYANPIHDVRVPMDEMSPGSKPMLSLEKTGTGALHYFVAYSYALGGPQPGIIAGLRIIRYVRPANGTTVLWESGLSAPSAPLSLNVGQVYDVELEVIADHPVDQVVITDPLPAGFEAVDASFQTSTQFFQAATDSWQLDYQAIYRDRVVAYGDHLDAGDYSFHYLVRSVTPGTFSWPGADAHLQYAPEIFGRTSSGTLQLK